MSSVASALLLAASLIAPVAGGEDIVVLQETRIPERARQGRDSGKPATVRHSAILKNTGHRPVRSLRVSVELYDYFGALLWARTVSPTPSALGPGETAVLSLATPGLDAHRRTRYRFEYRTDTLSR